MRILYLDALMMAQGFKDLGHEVFCAGPQKDADIKVSRPRDAMGLYAEVCATGFVPDCVFWCDSSNLPFLPGIEKLPCATAYYSIDTYCQHWHFGFANAFDAVFVAQKDHVPFFPAQEVAVQWLPLFMPANHDVDERVERDIPVSFVGTRGHKNNPDREPFLQQFRRVQPLMMYSGPYKDIFRRSRIVLNQTACSEVNFRCFEAMACGAALLMERCGHGLEELLVPGEHILPLYTRGDWREAAAITSRALAEPGKLAEMAAHGRRHVLASHLARHRGQVVHDAMAELIREDAPKRRLERLDFRRKFLAASYAMLGYDLTGRVAPAYIEYCYNMSSATQTLTAS